MGPLVVIPTYLRELSELDVTLKTLETLRKTEPDLEVFVVDDGSPERSLVARVAARCEKDPLMEFHAKEENSGFSRTVNVGLRRAVKEERDAILCNADIEFVESGWVERMLVTHDSQDRPAAIVGALLLYPNGLIQHAGVFASFLDRSFDHRMRFAPGTLPEAHQPKVCPVTGALQLIRYETLQKVGLYDEDYQMAFEDVDYALRVFEAGLECVYQPGVRAIHHESLFRGSSNDKIQEWTQASIQTLMRKHAHTDIGKFIPSIG